MDRQRDNLDDCLMESNNINEYINSEKFINKKHHQ